MQAPLVPAEQLASILDLLRAQAQAQTQAQAQAERAKALAQVQAPPQAGAADPMPVPPLPAEHIVKLHLEALREQITGRKRSFSRMDSCSLLMASQHYEHELQILQRQMVGQLTLAKDLNDLELRRIRQEELSLSRQYPWNECIAAHTLPLPYVSPLPSPLLLTSWVCLSRLSHERRLMISSDPRSILTNCARRWPARQPLRPRQKAADSGTGEGGEGTDEASTAACGKHGLGRGAAVDASTRARAARGARSADGSRLRHGRGRREHRRGEHGQHGRGGRRGRRKHGRGHQASRGGRPTQA